MRLRTDDRDSTGEMINLIIFREKRSRRSSYTSFAIKPQLNFNNSTTKYLIVYINIMPSPEEQREKAAARAKLYRQRKHASMNLEEKAAQREKAADRAKLLLISHIAHNM